MKSTTKLHIGTSVRMGIAGLVLAASALTMVGGPASAEKPSPKKPPTTSTTVQNGPYLEWKLHDVLVSSHQS